MRYTTFVLLVLIHLTQLSQAQQEEGVFQLLSGSTVSGTVLDNYPPVYAILLDAKKQERIVDYPSLTPESAALLASILPQRYGPGAMPEIPDVSAGTNEYTTLDLVHFNDGKIVAGIVENQRYQKYFILRWPSGEEWICYNADVDTVTQMTLDGTVTFREYRHYYPGVSSTLSMIVPGLGHVYNGDYLRAGVHVMILAAAIGAAVLTANNSNLDFGYVLLVVNGVAAVHILDAVDAWGRSVQHETGRRFWQHQRCALRPNRAASVTLGFGVAPLPNGAAAGIQIRF